MPETRTINNIMFFPFFDPAMIAAQIELNRLEQKRWSSLSTEEKNIELRIREVRALEQQADAMRERNRIERGKFF